MEKIATRIIKTGFFKLENSSEPFHPRDNVFFLKNQFVDHSKKFQIYYITTDELLSMNEHNTKKLSLRKIMKTVILEQSRLSYDVDLKYSLWSADLDTWYSTGNREALSAMQNIFATKEGKLTIITSPKKEIRYGEIFFYDNGIVVEMRVEWDTPDDMGYPDDFDVYEWYGYWGTEITRQLAYPNSFDDMMQQIDNIEDELMTEDKSRWDAVENSPEYKEFNN